MILRILLIAALVVVLLGTYIRLAPTDPRAWHVDPATEDDPGGKGAVLLPSESPVWDVSGDEVLAKLDGIALDSPATTVIAGSTAEGRVTYMSRSAIWGFPDYVTVAADETDEGTRLSILSRARFGAVDLGVNQQRIDDWLGQLTEALPPQ